MAHSSFLRRVWHEWFTVDFWLCTTLMFLVEFGCSVLGAPSPRLLEIVVCEDYYRKNDNTLTQGDCKIHEVQAQLGFTLTVLSTFSVLAATLMQIPMGLLADKKGRKAALILNIISLVLYWGWIPFVAIFTNLPLWALYIAPIFIFIGGGPWASGALVFSAINRRITPSQRTPAFSIMEAISGIADLVGPALGTLTMEHNIWLPFLLATLSFTFMFVPTLLLEDEPMLTSTELNYIQSEVDASEEADSEERPLLRGISNSTYASSSGTSSFVNSTVILYSITFGSFFLVSLARDSNNFLIPWISWRFDESMARAGLIFSLRAIVSSLLFFVLLPLASSFTSKLLTPFIRDLFISLSSAMFLCIGSIMVAVSPSLSALVVGFSIMTLGSGVTISLRAFLASKIDRSFSGRLFAAISATSTIGNLVGMPVMGTLYSLSISKEESNISLPFAMSAGAYFLVLCVIGSLQFTI
ncbi:major facilitator superfamily domain-containing protein [Xylaria cf. heliscus]|nr:major facilitator superfamily domain-containing protein [Xylaria cf. heliscus]